MYSSPDWVVLGAEESSPELGVVPDRDRIVPEPLPTMPNKTDRARGRREERCASNFYLRTDPVP